jgi:uncharacterized protein (DUF2267 family)
MEVTDALMDFPLRGRKRNFGNGERRKKRRGDTLNFLHFAEEGNHFIGEVARELKVSRSSAARITKAVLHAVRDKLPPDDAIEFAQGLPMALKAVYIEQYDISSAPVAIRHPHDFLDYIFYKDEFSADYDFPNDDSVERGAQGVFSVLKRYMDRGQIYQLRNIIGPHLFDLLDGKESWYRPVEKLRLSRQFNDQTFYT